MTDVQALHAIIEAQAATIKALQETIETLRKSAAPAGYVSISTIPTPAPPNPPIPTPYIGDWPYTYKYLYPTCGMNVTNSQTGQNVAQISLDTASQ